MIKVTIEMDVGGYGKRFYPLAEMQIINQGNVPANAVRHDYEIRYIDKSGRCFRKAEVLGHPRQNESIWKLVKKAINAGIS